MIALAIAFPAISPTIVSIGGLHLRWYGVMYVIAFVLGSWIAATLLARYQRVRGLNQKGLEDLLFWVILGVIAGGRVGYILFYNLPYYLQNPLELLAVWKGGMSFHGGLIGVAIAGWLFVRKHKLSLLEVGDLLAVPSALGLMFGRIGNFINAELVGRPASPDLPWAMYFPNDLVARHPVQLYSAGKDLLLFALLLVLYRRVERRGVVLGALFLGYGILRTTVELFREPDAHIGFIGSVTLGQLLSLPLIVLGAWMLWDAWKRGRAADGPSNSSTLKSL